jgi:hypothetical protein
MGFDRLRLGESIRTKKGPLNKTRLKSIKTRVFFFLSKGVCGVFVCVLSGDTHKQQTPHNIQTGAKGKKKDGKKSKKTATK